jgi:hypothetical protein
VNKEIPSKFSGERWPVALCGGGGHDGAVDGISVKTKNGQNRQFVWQVRPTNLVLTQILLKKAV